MLKLIEVSYVHGFWQDKTSKPLYLPKYALCTVPVMT